MTICDKIFKVFNRKCHKDFIKYGFCGILIQTASPFFRDYGQGYLLYLYYKEIFIY